MEDLINHADGEKKRITGYVDSLPRIYDDGSRFIMGVEKIEENSNMQKIKGQIQVSLDGTTPPPSPGKRISFISTIGKIRSFKNPGCYDYARHMLFEGIKTRCSVKADAISFLGSEKVSAMIMADRFRLKAGKAMDAVIPDDSAVVKALITGDTSGISSDLREAFNRTGAGHLIAISGLNIGIIAAVSFFAARYFLSFWPFILRKGILIRCASFAAIFPVIFYGLISGLEPSALRAVIMASVILAAGVFSRESDILNSIAASAFMILAVMPGSLFSISFILSYMAVFFLILSAPVSEMIRQKFSGSGKSGKIISWTLLSLTVSVFATLGTAPFVMHYFGNFSPVGILANLILVPLFGAVAVAPGLLAVLFLPFSESVFAFLIKTSALPVRIGTVIIEYLAEFKYSSFQTISPDIFEVFLLYAIMFSGLVILNNRIKKTPAEDFKSRAFVLIFALSCFLMLIDAGISIKQRFFNKDLYISILDIGHGNAALAELPGGKIMLIDGGGFQGKGKFDTGKDIITPFLKRKKILDIDYMVLTHPDTDHIKGLLHIAENFRPEEFWKGPDKSDSRDYTKLMEILKKNGTKIIELTDTDEKMSINDVKFEVLNPSINNGEDQKKESTNDESLVLKLNFKDKAFLFTGDISENAESKMTKSYPEKLHADLILMPHHGSNGSGSGDFLDNVNPEVALISAGRKGLPGKELLQRLGQRNISTWRTDINGCITVAMDSNGYSIKAFRDVQK